MWFTNINNNSIGRITTTGVSTSYPGIVTGLGDEDGIAAGPDGALWFTNNLNGSIGRITTNVTPKVTGFNPKKGVVGTTVTIIGKNLSGATNVTFNGTTAAIISNAATKIVTTVPTGATTGHVAVTTAAGSATITGNFTVT